ncbi:MAG: AbrB/MazE/SpoVT family DNA-binding domain-containing protein [Candidatus Pacearchaeota archaeon]|jgi:antitoxin component of MazEF toxin-antitoxin module
MEIKIKPRKWGNSLAVILPKLIVDANRIKENQEITIEIKDKPTAKKIFGMLPRKSKKSAQQIKDEMRKGW